MNSTPTGEPNAQNPLAAHSAAELNLELLARTLARTTARIERGEQALAHLRARRERQ